MKHCIYIIFFCFNTSLLDSQVERFQYEICSDSGNFNSEKKASLFLIGEYHLQNGNFKILLNYYNYLNLIGLPPKYIIDESAPSWGYLMNKYLETGSEEILELIEVNQNQKQLYKVFREFYLALPDSRKFKFVGVDVERIFLNTHFAVRDILLQSKMYCDYTYGNIDSIKKCNCSAEMNVCSRIKSIKNRKNPVLVDDWLKGDMDELLNYLISEDSLIIKKSLKPELYDELCQIMKSYEISKKRKRIFMQNENNDFQVAREKFMTDQIYRLFLKDPTAIVYGQFGIDHVLLSTYKKHPKPYEKIRLAIALNSDNKYSLTNNKVRSNVIYYDYFKPKKYYFLQSNLKNIPNEFNNMKDCQLKIIDIENKSKANNLILFKTK